MDWLEICKRCYNAGGKCVSCPGYGDIARSLLYKMKGKIIVDVITVRKNNNSYIYYYLLDTNANAFYLSHCIQNSDNTTTVWDQFTEITEKEFLQVKLPRAIDKLESEINDENPYQYYSPIAYRSPHYSQEPVTPEPVTPDPPGTPVIDDGL